MTRRALMLCFALPALVCAQTPRNRAPLPNEQWVKLFNGKDLSGWHALVEGAEMKWSVTDGVLKNAPPTTDIVSNQEFVDSEFRRFFMRTEFDGEADCAGLEADVRAVLPAGAGHTRTTSAGLSGRIALKIRVFSSRMDSGLLLTGDSLARIDVTAAWVRLQ